MMDLGKRGIMDEPRVVRVWDEMPVGSRRSVDVRQRMRKRPVEVKSVIVVSIHYTSLVLGHFVGNAYHPASHVGSHLHVF